MIVQITAQMIVVAVPNLVTISSAIMVSMHPTGMASMSRVSSVIKGLLEMSPASAAMALMALTHSAWMLRSVGVQCGFSMRMMFHAGAVVGQMSAGNMPAPMGSMANVNRPWT